MSHIGQVTTLAYDDGANPLRITSITDPFAREATLTYNAAGQLESITDVLGLTSRFGYGPEDFVSTLTTPYGTTTFHRDQSTEPSSLSSRFIQATAPRRHRPAGRIALITSRVSSQLLKPWRP